MTKALLVAALTLFCCISILHGAFVSHGCRCRRTTPNPVAPQVIKKIEVFPISGNCRRTEIIVTRKNGSKVCCSPNAQWVQKVISNLQRRNVTSIPTNGSPTASPINF